jgi:hypothetical protein
VTKQVGRITHRGEAREALTHFEIGGLNRRHPTWNFEAEHFNLVWCSEDQLKVAPLRRRLVSGDLNGVD